MARMKAMPAVAAQPAPVAAVAQAPVVQPPTYPPIKQKGQHYNPDNALPKGATRKGRGFK